MHIYPFLCLPQAINFSREEKFFSSEAVKIFQLCGFYPMFSGDWNDFENCEVILHNYLHLPFVD